MSLSEPEIDLANAAAHLRGDGLLESFIGLADIGAGPFVGLLVNGSTVYGRMVSGRSMAEKADTFQMSVAKYAAEQAPEGDPGRAERWHEAAKQIEGKFVEEFDRHQKEERQTVEDTLAQTDPGDVVRVANLDADVARRAIRSHARAGLTLGEARVFPPGQTTPVEVDVLRVATAQIAAWWLLAPSEDEPLSQASFSHPVPG
jgi:hypothetical protein